MYQIIYSSQIKKDVKKINRAGLKNNVMKLIEILHNNPYQNPPPYEKLLGDLLGSYSRRINIQHRLIYQIYEDERTVKIIRMWTHYE
ncbi:addiction module protein [Spirochaetia bacterium]|nr:addiction module protein [Spirochaetia bacterium]